MSNDFFFCIYCMEINAFSLISHGSSDNGEVLLMYLTYSNCFIIRFTQYIYQSIIGFGLLR